MQRAGSVAVRSRCRATHPDCNTAPTCGLSDYSITDVKVELRQRMSSERLDWRCWYHKWTSERRRRRGHHQKTPRSAFSAFSRFLGLRQPRQGWQVREAGTARRQHYMARAAPQQLHAELRLQRGIREGGHCAAVTSDEGTALTRHSSKAR